MSAIKNANCNASSMRRQCKPRHAVLFAVRCGASRIVLLVGLLAIAATGGILQLGVPQSELRHASPQGHQLQSQPHQPSGGSWAVHSRNLSLNHAVRCRAVLVPNHYQDP